MTEQLQDRYLAAPAVGRGPGVLVLHAWWGLNDFTRAFCDRLAQDGFVALAPDLYHGKTAKTVEEAQGLARTLKRKQLAAGLFFAVEELKAHPAVHGDGLGLVGFSLGAYWGLWLAREKPEDFRAVTVFYGTRSGDYGQSKAAYLGHFAETDPFEPDAGVKKLERSLKKASRPTTFYTYEGTGHWFFEEDRADAFHSRAAQLAWERTTAFLHHNLDGV